MSQVVCGHHPSVHSAFQSSSEDIGVSITSLYNKLNGIEPGTSAELVKYAANQAHPLIEDLRGAQPALVSDLRVKLLDGNCIEASEHRIKELRPLGAGALPGKSLVVYDPSLRIPIYVVPCEDGHAQERSLLGRIMPCVENNDLWIADRNFCVRSFLFSIALARAYFLIRLHANLPYTKSGEEKYIGTIDGTKVFEQPIAVVDDTGKEWKFRLIRVILKRPTRDGDKEIFLITNASKSKVNAKNAAVLYRKRWRIETTFQELKHDLNSEINTLGYPPAALFAFCVALVAYMIVAVIKAALSSIHGAKKVDIDLSGYYMADEISGVYRGMMIAISPDKWHVFRNLSHTELVALLRQLAANVNMSKFKKHPRGPKKPSQKRVRDPKHPHVSTALLLAARKSK
jgi:hypothetical protein